MKIICFALLFAPLIWELQNDKDGESKDSKGKDVLIRIGIALTVAVIGWLLVGKPVIDGFILSLSIHFFLFDYILNFLLIAGGVVEPRHGINWWSYIGNTAVMDRWKFWRDWGPWGRFWIRAAVLALAIYIYIK